MKKMLMKRKLVLYLFFFVLSIGTRASTSDTSTTKGLIEYIFQYIDKTQVPTGFLEEYGCPVIPMATFNGYLTDSNRIDMNLWRLLYFQMQTGFVGSGSNPLAAIASVNTGHRTNTGDTVLIPYLSENIIP